MGNQTVGISDTMSDVGLYMLPWKQTRNWHLLCECKSVKFVQRETPVNTEVQRQNGKIVGGRDCGLPMMLFLLNHQPSYM